MAGETGTQGSEFPIFKSGEGAFDRAKYKQEESAMVDPSGNITGKTIDEDLKKKKKSADDVIKEANKFYNESLRKNLRALDPAYDPKLIYYSEAYAGDSSDRSKIKRKIDDGEVLDGKEIFEMSKGSAQNKLLNAQILKTGSVTQIVENLGIKNIKGYEKYDEVKGDFDSKVKDDSLKFDNLLSKFYRIVSYFNETGQDGQAAASFYTPENNSIISALAKILEGEGFGGESVLAMVKTYEENLGKLIDKSKRGSIESMKMTKEGDVVKSTGEGVTEEKKLEEKKEEAPAAPVPTPAATVEEPKIAPVEPAVENKSEENKAQEVAPAVSSAETKLGEVKNPSGGTGSTEESKSVKSEGGADAKVNSMLKDLFGIDPGGAGGTGATGDNKETGKVGSETEKLASKKAEDIFGAPKRESGSTGGTEKKEPEKKSEGTKLETKIDKKNDKVNETLPVSTGKIETTAQNLSSVSNPVEKPKEQESTSVNTTNTTATNNTSSNTGSSGSTTTEAPKSETAKDEKKVEGNKTEGEGNKEMLDTMKSMVSLLTQLNSTMQGPLIVTPTNKKFQ